MESLQTDSQSPLNILFDSIEVMPATIWVAYSGGLDSLCLLVKVSQWLQQAGVSPNETLPKLKAIHVHHGLQAVADDWVVHCESVCEKLSIPLVVKRVLVNQKHSGGIEAAARAARYAAIYEEVAEGEVVALAHHAEDQMETLLFRMIRGTGIDGLAGMQSLIAKRGRYFWRPLLKESKQVLRSYVESHKLEWIEDPSNQDLSFSRNYLRSRVTPVIQERWPSAMASALRLSEHAAEAIELHQELAALDKSSDSYESWDKLARASLLSLSVARQKNLIRHSIHTLDLAVPSEAQLEQILQQMVAQHSSTAVVSWHGGEVRMHRQTLYFMLPLIPFEDVGTTIAWDGQQELKIPSVGRLTATNLPAGTMFEIRFRQGGEKIHPQHQAHNKLLRRWLQEWETPSWLRQRVPLIYYQGEFVAVPGWGQSMPCIWSKAAPETLKSVQILWQIEA